MILFPDMVNIGEAVVRLLTDKITKRPKGFAFAEFQSSADMLVCQSFLCIDDEIHVSRKR